MPAYLKGEAGGHSSSAAKAAEYERVQLRLRLTFLSKAGNLPMNGLHVAMQAL